MWNTVFKTSSSDIYIYIKNHSNSRSKYSFILFRIRREKRKKKKIPPTASSILDNRQPSKKTSRKPRLQTGEEIDAERKISCLPISRSDHRVSRVSYSCPQNYWNVFSDRLVTRCRITKLLHGWRDVYIYIERERVGFCESGHADVKFGWEWRGRRGVFDSTRWKFFDNEHLCGEPGNRIWNCYGQFLRKQWSSCGVDLRRDISSTLDEWTESSLLPGKRKKGEGEEKLEKLSVRRKLLREETGRSSLGGTNWPATFRGHACSLIGQWKRGRWLFTPSSCSITSRSRNSSRVKNSVKHKLEKPRIKGDRATSFSLPQKKLN